MNKLLKFSSVLALVAGIIMVLGGVWAIKFTYDNIVREKITTAADSTIPNQPLRGPLTLKAQADIIRVHTLKITGGKTYAEMPRQIQMLDEEGNPVLDESGNPKMTANTARDLWITANTLITALNLGIITYLLSALVVLFGLISIWTGIVFYHLSKKQFIS